jgi:hypothetical protein
MPKILKSDPPKNAAAQALVRRRWDRTTPEQRKIHARKMAAARWAKRPIRPCRAEESS